jgi:hypothetical protein
MFLQYASASWILIIPHNKPGRIATLQKRGIIGLVVQDTSTAVKPSCLRRVKYDEKEESAYWVRCAFSLAFAGTGCEIVVGARVVADAGEVVVAVVGAAATTWHDVSVGPDDWDGEGG